MNSQIIKLLLGCVLVIVARSSPAASVEAEAGMLTFDLAELADGETRQFGYDDHTVSATRVGQVVTITTGTDGEVRSHECTIGRDRCVIMTLDDATPDHQELKLMVMRRGQSTDGDDQQHVVVTRIVTDDHVGSEERDHHVWVMDSEDSHADVRARIRVVTGSAPGSRAMMVHSDDEPYAFHVSGDTSVVTVGEGDEVFLRCPEGDTHMRLAKDEADAGYTCPKHGVVLKKLDRQGVKVIEREQVVETAPAR